jgi:hypothetical protein
VITVARTLVPSVKSSSATPVVTVTERAEIGKAGRLSLAI